MEKESIRTEKDSLAIQVSKKEVDFDNVFIYLKNRWEYDENGIPVVKWMNEEEAYSFLEENKRL